MSAANKRDARPDPFGSWAGLSEPQLLDVLALVHSTDVVELHVTVGGSHLTLRRPATGPAAVAAGSSGGPNGNNAAEPFLAVTSPLVGIFRPSVQAGDRVTLGQPVGAIEALGMPTSVDAPATGVVEELLTGEGGAVEFGQSLLVLRLDL